MCPLQKDTFALLLEEHYRRHPELRGRATVHWLLATPTGR